jgi:hypothetical protein
VTAAGPRWSDDEALLAVLREALREERDVPPHFVEVAKATFTWHSIDAELAALTFDSLSAVGTRTPHAAVRELTFATRELTISVQVTDRSLHGQVVPPQPGRLEVQVRDGEPRVVDIDEHGWFAVSPVPREAFRLLVSTASGTRAQTDWFTV